VNHEFDGRGFAFGGFECVGKALGGVGEAVDGGDFLAGGEACFVGGAAYADVVEGAVGAEFEADREPDGEGWICAELGGRVGGGFGGVVETIAALLDAFSVDVGLDVVEAGLDEGGPVVGDDLVEVGGEFCEAVRLDAGNAGAAFLEEELKEVAESFLVVGEFADGGVDVEPESVPRFQLDQALLPRPPPPLRGMAESKVVSSMLRQARPLVLSRVAAVRARSWRYCSAVTMPMRSPMTSPR
jgi:hypothetical protein